MNGTGRDLWRIPPPPALDSIPQKEEAEVDGIEEEEEQSLGREVPDLGKNDGKKPLFIWGPWIKDSFFFSLFAPGGIGKEREGAHKGTWE